ncbi:hypothetical protein IWQ60_009378 [Tieghemiomyces parasiticus]|uniref:CDT1 Geminin-binding domain-containing protein n=1 Tax=Tieghemiomyces parasiticus TaxID=78921 RepID=A0A9W8DL87_9FUNG|nr:hypothetical protein IWQ60_009378 [Tieghemiomyces parasiticus]
MAEKVTTLNHFLSARKANIHRDVTKASPLIPRSDTLPKKRKLVLEDSTTATPPVSAAPKAVANLRLLASDESLLPRPRRQSLRKASSVATTPLSATPVRRSLRTRTPTVKAAVPTPVEGTRSTKRRRAEVPVEPQQTTLQFSTPTLPSVPIAPTQPSDPGLVPEAPLAETVAPTSEAVKPSDDAENPFLVPTARPDILAARQQENAALREAHTLQRYGLAVDSAVPVRATPVPFVLRPPPALPCPTVRVPTEVPQVKPSMATDTVPSTPAFRKFQHLTSTPASSTAATKLPLPSHCQRLDVTYQALEHTLVFLKGQNQSCVYHRLRKPVENMCRRSFELEQLGQLVTVYPGAYRLEPVRHLHNGQRVASVEIHFGPALNGSTTEVTTSSSSAADTHFLHAAFASTELEKRRVHFRHLLLELVHAAHNAFLIRRALPPVATYTELAHWHPDFSLDTDVPAIPSAELPRLELQTVSQQRVQDLLGRLQSRPVTPKTPVGGTHLPTPTSPMALSAAAAACPTPPPIPCTPTKVATPSSVVLAAPAAPTKVGGGTLSLLDRIRQKEQLRKRADLLVPSEEQTTQRAQLSRLAELADTLSFLFYSSKRTTLRLRELVPKLVDSSPVPITEAEAVQLVSLLARTVPQWCQITMIAGDTMVKLDRTVAVREAKAAIQRRLKGGDGEADETTTTRPVTTT